MSHSRWPPPASVQPKGHAWVSFSGSRAEQIYLRRKLLTDSQAASHGLSLAD
jgi:hypothetical protein